MEVEFYEALTGLQFKMAVNPTDTVLRIKLNIEEHHSISVANQTLRLNGVTLHDGHVINPATDTPIELIVVDYPDEDDDPEPGPDPGDVAPPPPSTGSRIRIKIIPPRGSNPPARSSLGRERSTYLRPSRSGSASHAEARNLMPPPRPVEPESDSDDDDDGDDQDDILYGC